MISAISIGGYHLGTADKETPLGHLMHSAYYYVISETMGFHVDYEKSLGSEPINLSARSQAQLSTITRQQNEQHSFRKK